MKSSHVALLFLLGATPYATASADVTTTGADLGESPGSAPKTMTSPHLEAAFTGHIKPRQLRCWQEGRLILEENDWHPADSDAQLLLLRTDSPHTLQLYSFGGTFCIYREES